MSEPIKMENEKDENSNNKDYEIINKFNSECDLSFKLIVIGDAGVGKSALSLRATRNTFNSDYSSTIGFEYFKYLIKLTDYNKIIRLHIWDTCGQEVYRSLINNYYNNSSLAILVFAIDK